MLAAAISDRYKFTLSKTIGFGAGRIKSEITVEERVQIIDSRINTIDLRLAGISSDILGLQTEQNRIKEYLFNRPQ